MGTMRCGVVLCEIVGNGLEQPDAIGWKLAGLHSILVECKTSRADFVRDGKKCFRRHPEMGMGQERWYLTTAGLLQPSEVPETWGLAEIHGSRIRKIKLPPKLTAYKPDIWRMEIGLLFSALRKVELGLPVDSYHENKKNQNE